MRRPFVFALLTFSLSGCVLSVHDSKLADLKPEPAKLKDFEGIYLDSARYFTPPNFLGLEGDETLGSALVGLYFKSDVKIGITDAGDISVAADGGAFGPIAINYVNGRDFDFKDYAIVFKSHRETGTSEVVIGTVKTSMIWMLDSTGQLVVIKHSGGAGLGAGVIPLISSGSTFSTFARKPL